MQNSAIVTKLAIKRPFNTWIVKHKSSPVTNEMQLVGLLVSYFKLTIVLIIPNAKTGIPIIDSPNKT